MEPGKETHQGIYILTKTRKLLIISVMSYESYLNRAAQENILIIGSAFTIVILQRIRQNAIN